MNDQQHTADLSENYLSVLRNRLEANNKIPDDVWIMLREMLAIQSAGKNTVLLDYGNHETVARFLVKGLLKIVYHDAESYVYDFREKNDFLCDVHSLVGRKRTGYTFTTITECEWIELNSEDLLHLSQRDSSVMSSLLKRSTEYYEKGSERLAFLRIKNAEERYREFCQMRPEVVKYAKLIDIASFLDITPQSLSRIRKK